MLSGSYYIASKASNANITASAESIAPGEISVQPSLEINVLFEPAHLNFFAPDESPLVMTLSRSAWVTSKSL